MSHTLHSTVPSVRYKRKPGASSANISGVYDQKRMTGSVMLTAGHKLTSSVDPERDTAVGLRQVWSFEAVFVLESAMGRFFWRRGTCDNIGETALDY